MHKEMKERFDYFADKKDFSGAGFVKHRDDVIFSAAYGYAHKGFKVKNHIETSFDTASITKLFTAVAVMQLVDKGLLTFSDSIIETTNKHWTFLP